MKKTYLSPKMVMVEVESNHFLAGSGADSFNNQVTSASALGKGMDDDWDEEDF